MANITVVSADRDILEISFASRQGQHVRVNDNWTDWMLQMNDFRDLITPLNSADVDRIIQELLNNTTRLTFSRTTMGEEFSLSRGMKIVRRLGHGAQRHEYQSAALFVPNPRNIMPPPLIELQKQELLQLIKAMITLDAPSDYFIKDSLRNLQYLLAILWLKKTNPALLSGTKKLNAKEIFRVSLEQ